MQSIGIFGGTFDPVHTSHLTLAQRVRDVFSLNTLMIVPAFQPPHKHLPAASFAQRAAMIELALAACPDCERIVCSRIEGELPVPSYTVHTVEAIMQRCGGHRFVLIIGRDTLADLPSWYRARDLLALVDLIVVNRDQAQAGDIELLIARLAGHYRPISDKEHAWQNESGHTLQMLMDFHMPCSSSAIRTALRRGEHPAGLPDAVAAYIRAHRLYGSFP